MLQEELREEDRALAWRTVIFLIFPLVVFLDLRTTIVAAEWVGGSIKEWYYGVLWFQAVPQNLPSVDALIPVLFAGVMVQLVLAFCLLPALFFRPHPFVATLIGYSLIAIFVDNLVVDPLLALVGAGGSRWQIAYASAPHESLQVLFAIYAFLSVAFLIFIRSRPLKLWFAELSRPLVAEQLRIALSETKADPYNQFQTSRLVVLLEQAGMRRQSMAEFSRLRQIAPGTLYLPVLDGYLLYRRRQYKKSCQAFELAARFPSLPESMQSTFWAAAACCAFAQGEMSLALNLAERSLEFDDACLVARMVRVDAFLRLGKKDQAGKEVLMAIRQGFDSGAEDKIPMDAELVIRNIFRLQRSVVESGLEAEKEPSLV